MPRILLRSPAAAHRLERADSFLARRRRDEEVVVMGASVEAAADLARAVALRQGSAFGWYRTTLGRAAGALAAGELAARGLAPVGALPLEALCARVVDVLRREGGLGRFQAVAHFPGLPRALARTLAEIRLAGLDPEELGAVSPELVDIHRAYEAELARAGVADRAQVLRVAAEVARRPSVRGAAGALVGRPLLLLDVPVSGALERDLVAALAARSPDVLATVPSGDDRSLRSLRDALQVDDRGSARQAGLRPDTPVDVDPSGSPLSADADAPPLRRLQAHLFSESAAPRGALGEDVVVLSAPGESRECVEIARRIHAEAARGVRFDRMAVLLRAPAQYRAHLEEALRRASVPAYFAKGTVEPDPAGRAFAVLLACAAENLSARRFAEYLSIGQVPAAADDDDDGAPPPEPSRWARPDEELAPRVRAPGPVDDAVEPPPSSMIQGAVRAPRRWERLLVDAAVIGGLARWESRLDALEQKLTLDLAAQGEGGAAVAERIRRSLGDLAALRRFALPLVRALAALPAEATWGAWIEALASVAKEALRRPERVLAVLAEVAPMAEVGPVDLAEVRLVLHKRLTDLCALPEGKPAGRVFVGPVEAARGLAFDVVFVPGVAEKLFPQKVGEEPILGDAARARLGLDTNHERIAAERLALRLAVGAATARLVLSYPRVDMDASRPRVPSFYGLEVLRAAEGQLPGFDELARRAEEVGGARIGWPAPARPELAIDDAEYDLALLERLFHLPEKDTVGTARYLLGVSEHLARALRSRARRWTVKKWMPADGLVDPTGKARAALDRHLFEARSFSPTALQTFATCPYKFLLYAIHKIGPRTAPEAIEEMDPLQRGTLVHEALYELNQALLAEGLLPIPRENQARAREVLDLVMDRVAARFEANLAPSIDRVWADGIASVRADLHEWLRHAAEDGDWTPWLFELSFGLAERRERDPHSRAEPVELDCGIKLRGSIDLVEKSAAGTLRATDYKTGRATAKQGTKVAGGQVLQPVFYALALEKMFPETPVDLGRLYYCTSAGNFEEVVIELDDFARSAAYEVATTIGNALREGFFPAAPAKGACERCDYRPVCGPYEEIRAAKKSPDRLVPIERLRGLP